MIESPANSVCVYVVKLIDMKMFLFHFDLHPLKIVLDSDNKIMMMFTLNWNFSVMLQNRDTTPNDENILFTFRFSIFNLINVMQNCKSCR